MRCLSVKHGFIKVAATAPQIKVADCQYNASSIIAKIGELAENGAKLIVFPELCITGSTCGDLFFQPIFISSALKALNSIAKAAKNYDAAIIVGLPFEYNQSLYDCAAVISGGKILGIVPKTSVFGNSFSDKSRYFAKAPGDMCFVDIEGDIVPFGTKQVFKCKSLPNFVFGVEIGEDMYSLSPVSARHAEAGATVIANISAECELVSKEAYRRNFINAQASRLKCAYIFANAGEGESTTDCVYSGHCIISENGHIIGEGKPFSGACAVSEADVDRLVFERRSIADFAQHRADYIVTEFDISVSQTNLTRRFSTHPFIPEDEALRGERCEQILVMQASGLKKRWEHTHAQSLVLGISGGLDSSLALLVCCRAADMLSKPRTDIIAVTMPGLGTTGRTKNNAVLLCKRLGVTLKSISITNMVKTHFADISHSENTFDTTYENAQARSRTLVLMDLANKYNGLVIGTGDLSELALGWATYNGDHMSMYGVNASIPKTLLKHMIANYSGRCNDRELSAVLEDILATPVSPELLPADNGQIAQKTEDLVGPYELHDFFLYHMIR
ncbi:MAG: NAD(+) synthase, partial [Clostridiales bacterium]|nr:NAD(+) synthase [Clostridiales bacterium]